LLLAVMYAQMAILADSAIEEFCLWG